MFSQKGDGPQEISSDCSEPLGAFTFLSTPYSEVAQEERLRIFHRRDSLVRHTLVEQCQQRIVREVDGRYEQDNRRAPLVSVHNRKRIQEASLSGAAILSLFLPQLPYAEEAQLDAPLDQFRQDTIVQVTPVAQGLRDMDEHRIAFPVHSHRTAVLPVVQHAVAKWA